MQSIMQKIVEVKKEIAQMQKETEDIGEKKNILYLLNDLVVEGEEYKRRMTAIRIYKKLVSLGVLPDIETGEEGQV